MFVSKVIMASLPNIELVTFLIIIIARSFGFKSLISVYTYVFLEILIFPKGDWVVAYLYAWAIFALIICLIRKIDSVWVYTLLSGIFGFLFEALFIPVYYIEGGIAYALAKLISGAEFSLIHGFSNIILTLILYKPITKAAQKAFK